MPGRHAGRFGALGLVAILLVIRGVRADDPASPPASFEELQREHEKAREAIAARREAAKTAAEREAVTAESWKETKSAARRAFAWAEAHPDDPKSVEAIIWTVHGLANGYYPEYAEEIARAYTLLRQKALGDERVAPVCYYSGDLSIASPEAKEFLDAAMERSPSRLVRGAACLALAEQHEGRAHLARRLSDPITRGPILRGFAKEPAVRKILESVDVEADDRLAEIGFERLAAEFGDVKLPYPYNETPFAEMARGNLFHLRNLAIGRPAPPIEGEDMNGKPLRLADYRGKVVVITFWATWCGPCMGMVPHERELVKRLGGKPFALLGVNGDDLRENARAVAAKEGMTWPSWWNGGKQGGIVAAWGVRAWPTIYVLDGSGSIRYENVRGEMLDKAVDRLLAEMESPPK